jgi:hypothetical protein
MVWAGQTTKNKILVLLVYQQEHAGKPALPTISPFSFGRFGEL